MILTISCGYAPAGDRGPLGKIIWEEILTEGGTSINAAPDAHPSFGSAFFNIGVGKAGLLALAPDEPTTLTYYAAGQRLIRPANPGDRVRWQDRLAGQVMTWTRSAGLVLRAEGFEPFAVRDRSGQFRHGDRVTFTTMRDVNLVEWAVDVRPATQIQS